MYLLLYERENERPESLWDFNLSKEVIQGRLDSYNSNKPFVMCGISIYPYEIRQFGIYRSKKSILNYKLPNGETVADEEDFFYIVKCFNRAKVKGITACIDEFDILPPQEIEEPIKTPTKPLGKVFIVHGRDEKQALRLQKYLTKRLKIDAEMFEDFKEESGSNTIIEQLEYIKNNVGYAFIIVTPDDLGCLREDIDKCRTTTLIGKENIKVQTVCDILDSLRTRARQNVVFEHGLFIGALGRDRVCSLFQEDTKEKPSDIDGILYVGFKKSVKETFTEITEKLRKAGLIKS